MAETTLIEDYQVVFDTEAQFGYIQSKDDTVIPMAFLTLKGITDNQESIETTFAFDPADLAYLGATLAAESINYTRKIAEELTKRFGQDEPAPHQRPIPSAYL